MKFFNFKKMRIAFVFLIILTTLPVSITSKASSGDYYVSNYDVQINITPDGSANVRENITFDFDGTFHGVYLNIDPSGSDGIKDMKLSVLKGGIEVPVIRSASQNPETYTMTKDGEINKYKVYEPSEDEAKTFVFNYKLLNVITNHKDIAEFDRLVVAKIWDCFIENIKITVILPKGAKAEDLMVYGHGPLTGDSEIINGNTVEFTVPEVQPYTYVESIVLFPTSLTPNSINTSKEERLPTIIKREQSLADQANAEREEARKTVENERRLTLIACIMFGILMLIWIIVFIFIYIKYDKEVRPEFTGKYYRELPGNYSPAEMSLVMGSAVDSRDIMATLLDLVRRKHLKIENVVIEKKGIFKTKKIEDYKFVTIDEGKDDMVSHEKNLLKWLMNSVGDGTSFSIEDLKDYTKVRENALEFSGDYNRWKKAVEKDYMILNIKDESVMSGKILGIAIGVIYFVIAIVYFLLSQNVIALACGLLGIIMIFYSSSFTRRTKFGSDQHSKWHGFKRFLEDFSQMKEANINSIVVWEHYLVYAVSLGVAEKVIKYLPEILGPNQLEQTNMTNSMLFWQLGSFNAFNNAFNNTINAVNSSVLSAQTVAMSHNSSGFGGGGGFSGGGGGGFGGGGGGGGGAF